MLRFMVSERSRRTRGTPTICGWDGPILREWSTYQEQSEFVTDEGQYNPDHDTIEKLARPEAITDQMVLADNNASSQGGHT